jgi:proteasomal ATPase-associated factor 1
MSSLNQDIERTKQDYYLQIQPDWREDDEECWVNLYERTTLRIPEEQGLNIEFKESSSSWRYDLNLQDFQVKHSSSAQKSIKAAHLIEIQSKMKHYIDLSVVIPPQGNQEKKEVLRTLFQCPNETASISPSNQQLYAVDLSMDEKYLVVGGTDGLCVLWNALDNQKVLDFQGHISDVTTVRFFPSSKVVLTGSMDFNLRIWSVENGQCAAILSGGHCGSVEDTAILGKGRNVMSCGNDGHVNLWHCGSQQVITKWETNSRTPGHCLAILRDKSHLVSLPVAEEDANKLEAETADRVAFVGLEQGGVVAFDIRSRQQVMNVPSASPILSLYAESSETSPQIVTGTQDGVISAWDLRHTQAPIKVVSRSSAPIHSIVRPNGYASSIWTAHGDGVCSNWSNFFDKDIQSHVLTELTGPLYDPVRGMVVANSTGKVWNVSRNGKLRTYIPHFVSN